VASKKKNQPGCGSYLLSIIILGALIVWGLRSCDGCFKEMSKQAEQTRKVEEKAVQRLHDIDDSNEFREALKKHLGVNNRKFHTLTSFSVSGESATLGLSLSDNLSKGFIRKGGLRELAEALQICTESRITWDEITVECTFELVDKYGQADAGVVMRGTFRRSELRRINWSNFLADDLPQIADDFFVHPALRD